MGYGSTLFSGAATAPALESGGFLTFYCNPPISLGDLQSKLSACGCPPFLSISQASISVDTSSVTIGGAALPQLLAVASVIHFSRSDLGAPTLFDLLPISPDAAALPKLQLPVRIFIAPPPTCTTLSADTRLAAAPQPSSTLATGLGAGLVCLVALALLAVCYLLWRRCHMAAEQPLPSQRTQFSQHKRSLSVRALSQCSPPTNPSSPCTDTPARRMREGLAPIRPHALSSTSM